MTTYAQFFKNSTGYIAGTIPPQYSEEHVELIEALGDRGIIVLDGRMSLYNMKSIARIECEKRGFKAFQIIKGSSLLNTSPVTKIHVV